jgi:hypothetical protein
VVILCLLGPAGATFSQPVEISITFDPAKFEGKTPVIYVYEAGVWTPLETTIVDNKAIAKVDHFSIFTLLAASIAPTPTPTPVVTPTPTPTPIIRRLILPPLYWAIIAIVVVVLIAVVAYVVLRRKRK